jgi:hypothetical protein
VASGCLCSRSISRREKVVISLAPRVDQFDKLVEGVESVGVEL